MDTPPEVLIALGLFFALYGGAMVRWWRGFASFARKIAIGTRKQLESMYGTDEAPRREMVSLIGGLFILFGAITLVAGIAKL